MTDSLFRAITLFAPAARLARRPVGSVGVRLREMEKQGITCFMEPLEPILVLADGLEKVAYLSAWHGPRL
jgi:hypothetical protein